MDGRQTLIPYYDENNNPKLNLEVNLAVKTTVTCLIDTGFSGGLALPKYYFSFFERKIPLYNEQFVFANGEKELFPIYAVKIKFAKKSFDVKVMFINNGTPLVGISFLKHFKLEMEVHKRFISLSNFLKLP